MKSILLNIAVITALVTLLNTSLYAQYTGWSYFTTENSGVGSDTTLGIFSDDQDNLWFALVNGASKYDGKTWTTYNSSNSPFNNNMWMTSIEQIADTMYFAYFEGVYKHYDDVWELLPINQAKVLKKDGSNNLWIGTDGYGLKKYFAGNITTYNKYNSPLRSNRITDLELDAQQYLWITMIDSVEYNNFAGVAKFDGNNWTVYNSQNSGLINENIHQVEIDKNGDLWFGGDSLYLYKFDQQNWTHINITPYIYSSNWVNTMAIDSANNIWIGLVPWSSEEGVYKYDGKALTNFTTGNSGLPNNSVHIIKVDQDNNKWIGTDNRLAKFDDTPRLFLLTPNGGESLRSLSNFSITWNYQYINHVNVQFTTDGGISWIDVVNNFSAADKAYNWIVPVVAPQSEQCKIRIVDSDNQNVFDESDGFFTVFAKVETPNITPPAGTFNNIQTLTMTANTTGATIYYTKDGTEPTQNSILYTGPFELNNSGTIKAKSFKIDWLDSDTRTINYQFNVANLNFQPNPGTFQTPTEVTMTSITDSTSIYYTLDGSEPTQSSNLYQMPVPIDQTRTLKARGFRNGYTASAIKTGLYNISNQVITPIITTQNNWLDSDYNGFELNQVSGDNSTISYGNIESYTWYINGDSVASGTVVNLKLYSGTSQIKLKLVGDRGVTAETIKEVNVYCAKLETGGAIYSGVGQLDENTFFVTSSDDKIYQFDSTANVRWTILTGGDVQSTTCINDKNNIYIGSSDTRLYCFNESGVPLWDKAMGGVIVSSPSSDGDSIIYVGVSTGRLFAVSENSNIIWSVQTGGSIESSPSIGVDGTIYVGSADRKLYSMSRGGNILWNYLTNGPVISSPAISNDSSIIFGSTDGKLYKLDGNGNRIWSYDTGSPINSSPIIAEGGKIIFGSNNGNIYCLNADGLVEWQHSTFGAINGSPAISFTGEIYIGNDAGDLYVLNLAGEYLWKFKTGNQIKSPILINESNMIIFGNAGGGVFILKVPTSLNKRMAVNNEWPTFKGNNRRTGNKLNVITDLTEDINKNPKEYTVLQNYPNPFNPTTKISYTLPKSSLVQLKIFNLLGQEVATIVNEEKPAGNYEVNFDASTLSSGVYIYKIQAGGFAQTKKMILLK